MILTIMAILYLFNNTIRNNDTLRISGIYSVNNNINNNDTLDCLEYIRRIIALILMILFRMKGIVR